MSRPGTPVVLITGVCSDAMALTGVGLIWDPPDAVVVTHRIDVERQHLHRTVSHAGGTLGSEPIDLAHVCATCAVGEDIVPTLRRLAVLQRWQVVVACLPAAVDAKQVCHALAETRHDQVRVTAVVAALDGPSLTDTLTSESLLVEDGAHTNRDDRRGTAETACALAEYADVVSIHGTADPAPTALLHTIA